MKITDLKLKLKEVPRFSISEVYPGVFYLKFSNKRLMALTLMRFQEFYESPYTRGKFFSHEEFATIYQTQRKAKAFTYADDWAGFNFPSKVLTPFLEGQFKALSVGEKAILKSFNTQTGPFYVIATSSRNSQKVLHHEIAHGLFTVNSAYRRRAKEIIKRVGVKKFDKYLTSIGYNKAVHVDEAHAYLLEADREFYTKIGGKTKLLAWGKDELKKNFHYHFNRQSK